MSKTCWMMIDGELQFYVYDSNTPTPATPSAQLQGCTCKDKHTMYNNVLVYEWDKNCRLHPRIGIDWSKSDSGDKT